MVKNSKTRIYRASNHSNYSVINNQVLRRNDLSWKAKGIMCYILSLPDDWEIYLEELQKHAIDGKSSFRSGWNELKEKGYVKRHPIKESGKFVEWRTEIIESIDLTTFSPFTDFPQVGKPQMEKPQVENRKLLSTNNTNYLSKQNTDSNNIDQSPSKEADKVSLKKRFDKIWEQYPTGRKQGREKAFNSYKKAIKDGVTDETIIKGLNAYKKQIEFQRTDIQFVKQGSTWFNGKCWNDEYITSNNKLNNTFETKERVIPKGWEEEFKDVGKMPEPSGSINFDDLPF